jgi:hypothetical protein
MQGSYSVDFHRGWVIEITASEGAFKAICYSPCRRRLMVEEVYGSAFDALYAAKQQIDYQIACTTLTTVLQELHEVGHLNNQEWNSLQRSLSSTIKAE